MFGIKKINIKYIKISVIITVIITFLYLFIFRGYGFLLILWLTTPSYNLTDKEKALIGRVKKESNAVDVWREPKYRTSSPIDDTYIFVIKGVKKNSNIDSLEREAKKLTYSLDSLELSSNFVEYWIIYDTKEGITIKNFTYKREKQ